MLLDSVITVAPYSIQVSLFAKVDLFIEPFVFLINPPCEVFYGITDAQIVYTVITPLDPKKHKIKTGVDSTKMSQFYTQKNFKNLISRQEKSA